MDSEDDSEDNTDEDEDVNFETDSDESDDEWVTDASYFNDYAVFIIKLQAMVTWDKNKHTISFKIHRSSAFPFLWEWGRTNGMDYTLFLVPFPFSIFSPFTDPVLVLSCVYNSCSN